MNRKMSSAVIALAATGLLARTIPSAAAADAGRPVLIEESAIAKAGPAPHEGVGSTIGIPFSATAGIKHLYFSKRILHPGATVGRHLVDLNEVYYLMAGEADLIDDGGTRTVKAGTAMFLMPGQTVELHQRGKHDAVLIVANYTP